MLSRRNYRVATGRTGTEGAQKRFPWGTVLLGLVLLYWAAVDTFGDMGLIKYGKMKAYRNALLTDVAALKRDNVQLAREVHALKTDPARIETLARDKLGLSRPGELVYYYDESAISALKKAE